MDVIDLEKHSLQISGFRLTVPLGQNEPLKGLCYKTSKNKTAKNKTSNFKTLNFKTSNYKTSKVTKDRITKRWITKRQKLQKVELQNVELQNVESYKGRITKGRKLLNIEKGRKLRYTMGKIRGQISSLSIENVAKNSPGLFLLVNSIEKNLKCRKFKKFEKSKA